MVVTKHGEKRIKERLGLSKKTAEKNAKKALELGLTHAETKSGLRKYLDKLYLSKGKANNMRVYHHFVYLFHNKTLLTIIALPHNLCKIADQLQQEKKSNLVEVQENG